jgi:TetR/AcrR family transcriptional regulator, transcriptional repressor for nem operon
MTATPSTREQILTLAQQAIAERGYSAFSFRELAAELGIKSASIHYHFPTKTHLGLEVAQSYRERFELALASAAALEPRAALDVLINIYRAEVKSSQRMTVCMMLAAEIKTLPEEIKREMGLFYQLNLHWIETQLVALERIDAAPLSRQVFALLQGGLMGAKTLGDPGYFDAVIVGLEVLLAPVHRPFYD